MTFTDEEVELLDAECAAATAAGYERGLQEGLKKGIAEGERKEFARVKAILDMAKTNGLEKIAIQVALIEGSTPAAAAIVIDAWTHRPPRGLRACETALGLVTD